MNDLFQQIRDNLQALEDKTTAHKEELVKVNGLIEQAKTDHKEWLDKVLEAETKYAKEAETLEETAKPLRAEVESLKVEIKDLVDKKATVQVEHTRLSQQNIQFRSYEAKAKHSLQAMEKSLTERENIVREREQLKPFSASLLPKD